MNLRSTALAICALAWLSAPTLWAAENEPAAGGSGSPDAAAALKRFRPAPGLKAELVAAEPLLENVVSFKFDQQGRVYVVETHRRRTSVFDIRSFPFWLDDDYSFRTVADRADFYRRNASDQNADFLKAIGGGKNGLMDFNHDGHIDWHDLEFESETIRLLTDTNGDGRFDTATDFATGFNTLVSGVAAGVLVEGANVWFTCIPDLWKFTLPAVDFTPATPFNAAAPDPQSPITGQKVQSGFGVHIAFGGHDMHGLAKGPDGRIYWSIADRGTEWRPDFASPYFPEAFLKQVLPDTGAIFRCEPDGSHIEVVAVGLRNPQELAFDDLGNLFTGDNNADGGDKARWVYVLPGSDSGWRIGWQWQNNPKLGAWNTEGMWWNAETNTAAWVLPHCGYAGRGPAGVAWYPGTGLPARYDGHFLMCDFPDGVRSFGLRPEGAGFRVVDDQPFLWNLLATDVDFGPDGGAYVSDWVEGWAKTGKGRLYRVFDEAAAHDPLVQETKALLASDFAAKTPDELGNLLGHRDQRVRFQAQWALAAKGEVGFDVLQRGVNSPANQTSAGDSLARLHGIWGLVQQARQSGGSADRARMTLTALLAAPDAEVRAQAVRCIGDLKLAAAAPKLEALLKDPSPRVRSLAAVSLARLQARAAVPALIAMLRDNADRDPWLRHSGLIGLVACASPEQLGALAKDDSEAVRVAAVDALRRRHDSHLTNFLADAALRVRAEAVRAIYDEQLSSLFAVLPRFGPLWQAGVVIWPKIAHLNSGTPPTGSSELDSILNDAIALRVANSHFQRGTSSDAAILARYLSDGSPVARLEAATLFTLWSAPPPRDRVTGLHHPLKDRVAGDADAAFPALAHVAMGETESPALRAQALRALAALHAPQLESALASARRATNAMLNKLADSLAPVSKPMSLAALSQRLETGSLSEQQDALARLGKMKGSETVLAGWLERLAAGKVPAGLALDLKEAAAANGAASLKAVLARLDAKRDAKDVLAAYRDCLAGGDAANGRTIFTENQALACQRCHSIQKGDGGEVGPLLGGIGSRQTREYLLESIVAPNARIAAGFENVVLTLKNGREVAGMVKQESADTVQVLSPEDGLVTVKTADIKGREHAPSLMLEGLAEQMSRRELRDLVEFLASLR